jgi:ribosomal protein S18 acetylase RimI-like enzyme
MELPGKWRFSRAARNLSGTLVGFWIASVRSPATLHTHRVGVAPEYRNAGVGRRLFQEVLREAELADLSVMTLLVSEEATGAIGFYRQLGFERQRDRDTGSLRPRDSARDSGTVVGNLTSIADGLRILLWRRVK